MAELKLSDLTHLTYYDGMLNLGNMFNKRIVTLKMTSSLHVESVGVNRFKQKVVEVDVNLDRILGWGVPMMRYLVYNNTLPVVTLNQMYLNVMC